VAASAAAPATVLSPGAGQIFACTLPEGKTMQDVWSTLDELAKFPRNKDPEFSIFFWTQMRGSLPYDFVLGVNSGDLVKMAEGLAEAVAAPGWDAWAQRFNATADCISGIVKSEQVRAGTLALTAGRTPVATVETFACSYNDAAKPGSLESLVSYFKSNYETIASPAAKTYSAWMWRPYRGTSGTWDFMFVGTNPDFKSWAQSAQDYDDTKTGQAIDAKFYEISTCQSTLWTGYWIVAPTAAQ
jgi:hypothetical protein